MREHVHKRLRAGLIGVFVLAAALTSSCVGPDEERQDDSVEPPQEAALVTADDHGAIIQEAGKEDVMAGLNRQGKKIWSQPGHEGLAVCVSQCPKAIVSGSLDALNSPVVATPEVGYHTADIARLPKARKVFVPVSINGQVLVVTADKSGKSTARWWGKSISGNASPLESSRVFWNPGQGASGVLFSEDDGQTGKTFARVIRRAGDIGSAIQVDEAGSGCAATDGSWILPMHDDVILHRPSGKKDQVLNEISAKVLGTCVIGPHGSVIASSIGDPSSDSGKTKIKTRLIHFNANGKILRERTETGESAPVISPDGTMIALRSGSAVVVETIDGHTKKTYDGKIAAVFTPSGQLALMTPKGKVTWERP